MIWKSFAFGFAGLAFSQPAFSHQDHIDDYVQSNLSAILYHEIGHALIDVQSLPIFGQEEDAADVFSVLVIDAMFQPEAADQIALDTAMAFRFSSLKAEEDGEDAGYWDVHGPDEQRFFNIICLHYGADPEGRAEIAEIGELPQERAESCEEEREIAEDSWFPVLEDIEWHGGDGHVAFILHEHESVAIAKDQQALAVATVQADVDALNDWIRPDQDVIIRLQDCGEANAFYDPSDQSITMCFELIPWLSEQISH